MSVGPFEPSPCHRTTGRGCAALGVQDQSLTPLVAADAGAVSAGTRATPTSDAATAAIRRTRAVVSTMTSISFGTGPTPRVTAATDVSDTTVTCQWIRR